MPSDVVLSDDNFATIVAGVEEGRVAYENIRNVVYLLIAAGTAEVLTVGPRGDRRACPCRCCRRNCSGSTS